MITCAHPAGCMPNDSCYDIAIVQQLQRFAIVQQLQRFAIVQQLQRFAGILVEGSSSNAAAAANLSCMHN